MNYEELNTKMLNVELSIYEKLVDKILNDFDNMEVDDIETTLDMIEKTSDKLKGRIKNDGIRRTFRKDK